MPGNNREASSARAWLVALRSFAFPHTTVPVVLGAGVAYYRSGGLRWVMLALTVVGVLLFHAATNMLNDYWDYVRGIDTQAGPGSGALVRGLLSPRQVLRGAIAALVAGCAVGLYLVAAAGWPVLLLGALGALIGVEYTAPPLRLKDRGLGDAAVFLGCGPIPVFGSYWVQTEHFSWLPLLWSVPPALLVVATLHANNWRDAEGDVAAGSRTLAWRLGDRFSALYYYALIFLPFGLVSLYVAQGLGPPAALVSLGALLPPAVRLTGRAAKRHAASCDERRAFETLDTGTAAAQLAFGSVLAAAFFAAGFLS